LKKNWKRNLEDTVLKTPSPQPSSAKAADGHVLSPRGEDEEHASNGVFSFYPWGRRKKDEGVSCFYVVVILFFLLCFKAPLTPTLSPMGRGRKSVPPHLNPPTLKLRTGMSSPPRGEEEKTRKTLSPRGEDEEHASNGAFSLSPGKGLKREYTGIMPFLSLSIPAKRSYPNLDNESRKCFNVASLKTP